MIKLVPPIDTDAGKLNIAVNNTGSIAIIAKYVAPTTVILNNTLEIENLNIYVVKTTIKQEDYNYVRT